MEYGLSDSGSLTLKLATKVENAGRQWLCEVLVCWRTCPAAQQASSLITPSVGHMVALHVAANADSQKITLDAPTGRCAALLEAIRKVAEISWGSGSLVDSRQTQTSSR